MQENRRRKINTAVIAESGPRDVTEEEKLDGLEEEEIVKEPTKTRAGV